MPCRAAEDTGFATRVMPVGHCQNGVLAHSATACPKPRAALRLAAPPPLRGARSRWRAPTAAPRRELALARAHRRFAARACARAAPYRRFASRPSARGRSPRCGPWPRPAVSHAGSHEDEAAAAGCSELRSGRSQQKHRFATKLEADWEGPGGLETVSEGLEGVANRKDSGQQTGSAGTPAMRSRVETETEQAGD